MSDLSRDHPDFTKLSEYKDLETELEITEENICIMQRSIGLSRYLLEKCITRCKLE